MPGSSSASQEVSNVSDTITCLALTDLGVFNPAAAFALALVGCISYVRMIVIIIAELLGAIAAAAVVSGLFPAAFKVATRLSPATSIARGVFIEMFLTAFLIITIFMLAAEKHRATPFAPIGIGLALFIAELAGVLYTGGTSLRADRSYPPRGRPSLTV